MNFRLLVAGILAFGFVSVPLRAESKPDEDEIVKLDPFVVEAKSLADAGFAFKATFRHHLAWAGIKEVIITKVGPHSTAKKAGLAVGERILQIRDVKVEGLGIKELQDEFAAKAVEGKVALLIQARGSDETRTVLLQFTGHPQQAPSPSPEPPPSGPSAPKKP